MVKNIGKMAILGQKRQSPTVPCKTPSALGRRLTQPPYNFPGHVGL
jgi:hypothetical protein